ncbi:MAG: N-6 DNA methylase [Thermodesulfobacteriota bacterium]
MLNLIALKKDLRPSEKTYILIERCLFLKFLEDKNFLEPQTLLNILKNEKAEELLRKFDEINSALNGDIFSQDIFTSKDVPQSTLSRLYNFFTSDYRKQIQLFPYRFDILPIELLSNIYEAFLKIEQKISSGIYYTPPVLADLILNETLNSYLKKDRLPTCIDFSCGSGVFLVEAFQRLIEKNGCHSDFEAKKDILKACIFGVEKDEVAARITIFSLYLKLLEGEDPNVLRKSIRSGRTKFPKLFGKNILNQNTLFDDLQFRNEDGKKFDKFDVIVGNPPWGVNPFEDQVHNDFHKMNLSEDKQMAVNDYQSSQYFILKAEDFMHENSMAGIVTNNSNFLATKGHPFRQRILKGYDIGTFYDLKECNSILFKKRQLEEIELGADEPPAVLIFKKKGNSINKTMKYITPLLDNLSKLLKIIVIKNSEIKSVPLNLFDDDILWRVLAVGDVDDYNLIAKLKEQKGNGNLKGSYRFQVTSRGTKSWKNVDYVDKDCIEHFMLTGTQKIRPEGVSIRREGSDRYSEKKLLIKRYVGNDVRIKAAYDDNGYRFKENLLALFFDNTYDYRILLALYNSSIISYFLSLNSAQIGKGTFDMVHANEIESAPIPADKNISPQLKSTLIKIVNSVYQSKHASKDVLHKMDEVIFDVYHLKDFEKQRIRDFFGVRERKSERSCLVNSDDFERYFKRFSDVFGFVLREGSLLDASAFRSCMIGAGITFSIVDETLKNHRLIVNSNCDIGNAVRHIKKRQLDQSEKTNLLKQEKIKLYDKNSLTIVKSNEYKDWTETEAIKDANEEIQLFLESLPEG